MEERLLAGVMSQRPEFESRSRHTQSGVFMDLPDEILLPEGCSILGSCLSSLIILDQLGCSEQVYNLAYLICQEKVQRTRGANERIEVHLLDPSVKLWRDLDELATTSIDSTEYATSLEELCKMWERVLAIPNHQIKTTICISMCPSYGKSVTKSFCYSLDTRKILWPIPNIHVKVTNQIRDKYTWTGSISDNLKLPEAYVPILCTEMI